MAGGIIGRIGFGWQQPSGCSIAGALDIYMLLSFSNLWVILRRLKEALGGLKITDENILKGRFVFPLNLHIQWIVLMQGDVFRNLQLADD